MLEAKRRARQSLEVLRTEKGRNENRFGPFLLRLHDPAPRRVEPINVISPPQTLA